MFMKQKLFFLLLLFLTAACFFAVSASASEPYTATVTWESGFVRNTASSTMAEGGLYGGNNAFSRTKLIYVSSGDVTVTWWAPHYYGNTVQYVSVRDANDDYVSCGMAGTNAASSVRETRNGVEGHLFSYTTSGECYLRITVYAGSTGVQASAMNTYASTLIYTLGANAASDAVVCPADATESEIFYARLANMGISLDGYESLSDRQKDAFDRVFDEVTNDRTDATALSKEMLDTFLSAVSSMDYIGLSARKDGNVAGIRSQYVLNTETLSAVTAKCRVSVGAIMGIGEYAGIVLNTSDGMTVEKDQSKGYVTKNGNASAIVVYDSDGGSYATNKFNTGALRGERTFSFTTMYGGSSATRTMYEEFGLVYRGFLVLDYDGAEYIFYFDGKGDLFGHKDATYGASTSVKELCEYFTTDYTDITGTPIYAKNDLMRSVVTACLDDSFHFTASDFSTHSGYYAADSAAGTDATVVITRGGTLTVTVNAARAGVYSFSFGGNTLGGYLHYTIIKNTSLGKTAVGSNMSAFQMEGRVGATENTALTAKYAAHFSTLYGTTVSSSDVELMRKKTYTYGDSATNPGNLAFRAVTGVNEYHENTQDIYLKEGTNTLVFSFRTERGGAERDNLALGISVIDLTLKAAHDTTWGKTLFAFDAAKGSIADGYVIGNNATKSDGTLDTSYTPTNALTSNASNSVFMMRNYDYSKNGKDINYFTIPFTVERTGKYELSAMFSNGGDNQFTDFYILEDETALLHKSLSSASSGGNATATPSRDIGEVTLEAGVSYVFKVWNRKATYTSMSFIHFAYVPEEADNGTETDFLFNIGDAGLTVNNGSNGTTESGAAILKKGNSVKVQFTPEVSGVYEFRMRFSHNGILNATQWGDRIVETINVSGGTTTTRLGYTTAEGKSHPANVTETRVFYYAYASKGTAADLTFTFYTMLANTEVYLEAVEVSLYELGDDVYTAEEMKYISDTKNYTFTPAKEGYTANQGNSYITFDTSNLGVYTYKKNFSVQGGTYRVFMLMAQGGTTQNMNMGVNFDGTVDTNNGIATGKFTGGTTLDIDDARALYGLTNDDLCMQTLSAGATLVPFGTVELSAGEHSFSVFNTSARVTTYAGLWLVRMPDHTVTVNFVDENGETLADSVTVMGDIGKSYEIAVPAIEGYKSTLSAVKGIFAEDKTVTVTYKRQYCTLRVDYYYPNGSAAADTYEAALPYGTTYSVTSPAVVGYAPSIGTVTGKLTQSLAVTVRYAKQNVALTVNGVDEDGNVILPAISAATVPAGGAYTLDLSIPAGYIAETETVSGVAGSEKTETVDVRVAKSQFTVAASEFVKSSEESVLYDAVAGTSLETLVSKKDTYFDTSINASVRGVYQVEVKVNYHTVCQNTDIKVTNTTYNPFNHWSVFRRYGGGTSVETDTTLFKVGASTAYSTIAYAYLDAGQNSLRFQTIAPHGYIGYADVRVTLVTPEWNVSDTVSIHPKNFTFHDGAVYNTETNTARMQASANKPSPYLTYSLTVPKTGVYDVKSMLAVNGTDTVSFTLTDAGGNEAWSSSFSATDYYLGFWNVTTKETTLGTGILLNKGTYTLTVTPNTAARVSIANVRFIMKEEIETVTENDGVFYLPTEDGIVTIDANYFPGFTRKSIAFSYDDGNTTFDPIVAGLLTEYGYTGTFMVNSTASTRTFYAGHAIESHLTSALHNNNIKYDSSLSNANQVYSLAAILAGIRSSKVSIEANLPAGTANIGGKVLSFAIPMSSGYRFDVEEGNVGNDYRGATLDAALATEFNAAATAYGKPAVYTASDFSNKTDKAIYMEYMRLIGMTTNRAISGGYSIREGDLYAIPEDFLYWQPSLHQMKLKSSSSEGYVNSYASNYLALADDGEMKCLFVWGHPTEIDSSAIEGGKAPGTTSNNITYADLEGFLSLFQSDDYYKGSMAHIEAYASASDMLTVTPDGSITNGATFPVYVRVNDGSDRYVEIPAGGSWQYTSTKEAVDTTALSTSIAKYYGNKSAAVSLTFDDGQYESLAYASGVMARYGLRGTAFVIPNYHMTSRVPASGAAREKWIADLQALVAEGYIDVGNHSNHHYSNVMYNRAEGETTAANASENFETEILGAHEILQSWFTNSRIITFATPGGGIGADCKKALLQYGYLVNRTLGDGRNDPYADGFDFYAVTGHQILASTTVASMNSKVDSAIANGTWYVEAWHYIEDESGSPYWSDTQAQYSVPRNTVDTHFAYLAEVSDDIWCGSFNDVAAYVLERKNTTVRYTASTATTLTLEAVSTLDGEGYDFPLTVKIELPAGWRNVTVTQNGHTADYVAFTENGETFIYADVVPNGGDITVALS